MMPDSQIHSQIGLCSAELLRRTESRRRLWLQKEEELKAAEEEIKQLAEDNQRLLQEVQRLKVALLDTNKLANERGEMSEYWHGRYDKLYRQDALDGEEVTGVAAKQD